MSDQSCTAGVRVLREVATEAAQSTVILQRVILTLTGFDGPSIVPRIRFRMLKLLQRRSRRFVSSPSKVCGVSQVSFEFASRRAESVSTSAGRTPAIAAQRVVMYHRNRRSHVASRLSSHAKGGIIRKQFNK